jgi:hypothetical protein
MFLRSENTPITGLATLSGRLILLASNKNLGLSSFVF